MGAGDDTASHAVVSILTRLDGRVQQAASVHARLRRRVSILTRLDGRVQLGHVQQRVGAVVVSILTRLDGRVQPDDPVALRRYEDVSILTRLDGRVQPRLGLEVWYYNSGFQSSPALMGGCNTSCHAALIVPSCFNPHPP